eukprot:1810112-Amphidinium_carterae.1
MTVRFDELVYSPESWRDKRKAADGQKILCSWVRLALFSNLSSCPEGCQLNEALCKLDRTMHAGSAPSAPHAYW